jgi:hypothetical protein
MGDAPRALGGAIPRDKTLKDCCVSFPKRTILSSASGWYQSRGRYSLFEKLLVIMENLWETQSHVYRELLSESEFIEIKKSLSRFKHQYDFVHLKV